MCSKRFEETIRELRNRSNSRLVKKKLNDLFPNKRENWIVQGVVALCLRRARFKPSKKKTIMKIQVFVLTILI